VVAGAVQDGNVVPGQTLTAVQQHRLVGLDREPVVRLLAGDEALGGVAVGGQRIGGDHGAGQLQSPSNGWNPGTSPGAPLTWRWRGRRGWCGPSRRADGPAGRRVGRPQGLAVDRDRPPPLRGATVTVGQPRAEHGGQRGGSTRAWVRRMVASAGTTHRSGRHAERRARPVPAGGVSGPRGDRGYRSGAGQDRSGGHGKDRDQRVRRPQARLGSWIVARSAGRPEVSAGHGASAWASWARAAGIEHDGSAGTGVHRDHEAVRTA
jgi:hypothetical protein